MTTRIIGIREFRQNMSKIAKEARKNKKEKVRFIVVNHLVPMFEVNPIVDEDELENQLIVEKYGKEIKESLEQARRGEVYTAEEVREFLRKKRR